MVPRSRDTFVRFGDGKKSSWPNPITDNQLHPELMSNNTPNQSLQISGPRMLTRSTTVIETAEQSTDALDDRFGPLASDVSMQDLTVTAQRKRSRPPSTEIDHGTMTKTVRRLPTIEERPSKLHARSRDVLTGDLKRDYDRLETTIASQSSTIEQLQQQGKVNQKRLSELTNENAVKETQLQKLLKDHEDLKNEALKAHSPNTRLTNEKNQLAKGATVADKQELQSDSETFRTTIEELEEDKKVRQRHLEGSQQAALKLATEKEKVCYPQLVDLPYGMLP
ncbi:hypothetical protein FB446DRAFT_794668 [Lentinula raphanica]|nr:hypothetical protein FB446DRAFT_794668 [Lentinula raphanica]